MIPLHRSVARIDATNALFLAGRPGAPWGDLSPDYCKNARKLCAQLNGTRLWLLRSLVSDCSGGASVLLVFSSSGISKGHQPNSLPLSPFVVTQRFTPCGKLVALMVVQSLNSPFFPPHIGAEPGRAKEESRRTCMRMLRMTPFFPPKSGEKPYLEVLSRFGLWRDFLNDNIQATISAFRLIKNMSINPKSVEFHQSRANPHSICFLSQYQR